jgi:hypothetical protein
MLDLYVLSTRALDKLISPTHIEKWGSVDIAPGIRLGISTDGFYPGEDRKYELHFSSVLHSKYNTQNSSHIAKVVNPQSPMELKHKFKVALKKFFSEFNYTTMSFVKNMEKTAKVAYALIQLHGKIPIFDGRSDNLRSSGLRTIRTWLTDNLAIPAAIAPDPNNRNEHLLEVKIDGDYIYINPRIMFGKTTYDGKPKVDIAPCSKFRGEHSDSPHPLFPVDDFLEEASNILTENGTLPTIPVSSEN